MSYRVRVFVLGLCSAVVALGPTLLLDRAVRWFALHQGDIQLHSMAERMIDHAEGVLDNAVTTVASLERGGVVDCSADNIRLAGDAVLSRASLKEIGIYDSSNRIMCTNLGRADFRSDPGGIISSDGTVSVSMVKTRVPGYEALGLRIDEAPDQGGLIALVAPEMVLADLLHGAMRTSSHARVALTDGTLVQRSGQTMAHIRDADPESVEAHASSSRYPLTAALAAPRSALLAPFATASIVAKIGGGFAGVVFLLAIGLMNHRRPTIEADIDAALRNGEFVPVYQPIIDVKSGGVAGCEVLVRWRKSTGETVRPDVFIPVVESTGQIIEITRSIMEQAVNDLADVVREQPGLTVSINLVAEHFASDTIVEDVRNRFWEATIPANYLIFEITERQPLRDIDKAKSVIERLQGLGCKVALDDAGTGHGGLAYIQQLGMDVIKIDRMFVDGIGTDSSKVPIVDALIELGHQLDMKIVAEGVETEEQFAYLRQRGTRFFQGYLFSTPLPAEAFCSFVRAFASSGLADDADEPAGADDTRQIAHAG